MLPAPSAPEMAVTSWCVSLRRCSGGDVDTGLAVADRVIRPAPAAAEVETAAAVMLLPALIDMPAAPLAPKDSSRLSERTRGATHDDDEDEDENDEERRGSAAGANGAKVGGSMTADGPPPGAHMIEG
jgi:hypothetical protein